ncbi:hypothetical protein NC653_041923 [Populus alba x Populus x berolinensis]|uniref:Uncharacterized protein n=1 Tax=Populus alba x Populus x berolinensis TaxID=444605 RepID=A0AAD6LAM6_9ROSI|nr:hypothetical protein NC653_041923 [Populus alba x Populus x berolinensis]
MRCGRTSLHCYPRILTGDPKPDSGLITLTRRYITVPRSYGRRKEKSRKR